MIGGITPTTSSLPRGLVVGLLLLLIAWVLIAPAQAQNGTIRVTVYPGIAVADDRSTINVSAEVRDRTGRLVPNGTQVVFGSRLGRFREDVVTTVNGYAVGILVAPGVPGRSTVTASVFQFNAVGSAEVEFVSSQEQLSRATDFIQIFSPRFLSYSPEQQVLEAAASNRGVRLLYRRIELEADSVQIDVNRYEVRAKQARLKVDSEWRFFEELAFNLSRRSGFGLARVKSVGTQYEPAVGFGPGIRLVPLERERLGWVQVEGDSVTPLPARPANASFAFKDLSESVTVVNARRAFIIPGRELQFQRADVYVAGNRILRVPLFQLNANSTSPVISDQFINVTGNQLAINYPYYLGLRPTQSSLLRFRYGTPYSTGGGAAGGTFLDYEFRWNQGDLLDGSFYLQGIGRSDWSPSIRQVYRPNRDITLITSLNFPANRSLFGAVSYDHRLRGFSVGYSGNFGRSVKGASFSNEQNTLTAELDPIDLGGPFRMFFGVSHSEDRFVRQGSTRTSNSTQVRSRAQMSPVRLGRATTVNASSFVGFQTGRNVRNGLTSGLTTTLSTQLLPSTSLMGTYEYTDSGGQSVFLGRHSLSASVYHELGNTMLSFRGTRSLDVDRFNGFAEGSYRFARDWRVLMQYSVDEYLGSGFNEWTALVGYRIGFRELGLSYSARTKRIGIELLGFGVN